MRFAALLAAAAVLLPIAAHAQPDKKLDAPPTCASLVRDLGIFETIADSRIEDTQDGCRLSNVYAGFGAFNRFHIREIDLKAPGLFADYSAQRLPSAVDLTISGFQLAPDTGSALNNYIIEMQSDPMDIHFAYVWDAASGALELHDFSVTAPHYGAYRLSAHLSDIPLDPALLDAPESFPGTLDQLVVELDNARFLASMLVPPLLGYLPYDADPRPLIEAYQQAAIGFVNTLPATDDTKAALRSFLAAFPKPTGDYTLRLTAQPGLELTSLLVDNPAQLAALLTRLQITASHTPIKQP